MQETELFPLSSNILFQKRVRMTQSRFGGRERNAEHDGRGAANGGGNGCGCGAGYTSKPKTLEVGLCKELENHIFDFGASNAVDLMHTTQE